MKLLGRLGPFLVGALVAYLLIPSDPVTYTDVVVPAARIIEREPPDRPPTIIERVRFITVEPRQVATAPGGAMDDVTRFCRPTTVVQTDTVEVPAPDPMLLFRSVSFDERPAWNPFAKDELLVTGPTSLGDLRSLDYPVRGSFDIRASGDTALARYPRGALVRDVVETGAIIYTAVDLVGLLLGGGP